MRWPKTSLLLFSFLCGCALVESDFFSEADKEKLRNSYLDETHHKFVGYEEICIFGFESLKYNEKKGCKNIGENSIGLIDRRGNCSIHSLGNELGGVGASEYESLCAKNSAGFKMCVIDVAGQKSLVLAPNSEDLCDD